MIQHFHNTNASRDKQKRGSQQPPSAEASVENLRNINTYKTKRVGCLAL